MNEMKKLVLSETPLTKGLWSKKLIMARLVAPSVSGNGDQDDPTNTSQLIVEEDEELQLAKTGSTTP